MKTMSRVLLFAALSGFSVSGYAVPPAPAKKTAPPAAKKTAPDPAVQALEKDLKSTDIGRRQQAIEDVSRSRDPRMAPLLLGALNDKEPSVRAGAARTLGVLRSTEAVSALLPLLKGDADPVVRRSAASSLGFIRDESAVGGLVEALKDTDLQTRLAACQALVILRSPSSTPALLETLKDPTPAMRIRALTALKEIGDTQTVVAIRPLMDDPNPQVQFSAVDTMGRFKDTASLPRFRKFLDKKNPPDIRLSAARAAYALGDKKGLSTLHEFFSDRAAEERLRVQSARYLAEINTPASIPIIQKVVDTEPEGHFKGIATQLLERLKRAK
jgi:HEAT repeat protein